MKTWILKDEWLFQMSFRRDDPKQVRVRACGVQGKDRELARCLARIIELSERSSDQGATSRRALRYNRRRRGLR